MTFSTMMQQEMGWYDKPEHSVGSLNARLAGDCGAVQGVISYSTNCFFNYIA